MTSIKVCLWQCTQCGAVVWAEAEPGPRCPGCDSYQTVKVPRSGQGPPLELDAEASLDSKK